MGPPVAGRGLPVVVPVPLEPDFVIHLGPNSPGDRLPTLDGQEIPPIAVGQPVDREHVESPRQGEACHGQQPDGFYRKEDCETRQGRHGRSKDHVQTPELTSSPMVPVGERHAGWPSRSLPKQFLEDRLLGMEAILSLVPYDGLRTVDDFVGDLQASMGRQVVHYEGPRLGVRQ
jgi:hypothetical protein